MKKDSILSYFFLSVAFFLLFASINATSVLAQETGKSKIVFASDATGEFDIWKMDIKDDASTGVSVNLTADFSGDCNWPRWSPKGDKIAFHSNNSGAERIWVMKADGSDKTRLTFGPVYSARNPSWSPHGTKIAYDRISGTAAEICIMNAYGMNRVCYGNPNPHIHNRPIWSPDGTKILYGKEHGPACEGMDSVVLWVMNADGTSRTALPVSIPEGANFFHVDWDRSGKILYKLTWCEYLSGGVYRVGGFLYFVKEDGTEKTTLHNSGSPNSWAFGGSQIIFADSAWLSGPQLFIKKLRSSVVRRITWLGTRSKWADFLFEPEELFFPIKNKKGETTTIYLK